MYERHKYVDFQLNTYFESNVGHKILCFQFGTTALHTGAKFKVAEMFKYFQMVFALIFLRFSRHTRVKSAPFSVTF